jgi:vacuolar-type H+-ATPase subunit F/Vma7
VSRIVVLGEAVRVEPFALAGAVVAAADDAEAVRAAWRGLAGDVAVVVATPAAAAELERAGLAPPDEMLVVTLP